MRTKAGITITFCGALLFILWAAPEAHAQASPAPTSNPTEGVRFQDSTNELSVTVGKAVLVDTAQPVQRVAVGVGDIVEAMAVSPTEIMLSGKAAGETSLIIWDIRGGRQFFNVTVRPSNLVNGDTLDAIRRELRAELPNSNLRVSFDNGNIFLRGTVKDLTSSQRAVQIASTAGKVINLLDVEVPTSDPQIMLKVRFESVDRSKELQLGINPFNLGLGNAIGAVTAGGVTPVTVSGASGGSGGVSGSIGTASVTNQENIFAFFPGLNVGAIIDAMETKGISQSLAQPNIVAMNGKEASFLAGGEFPYPVVSGTSGGTAAVSIEFKEYGIRLNFIPTITPRNTIRLQVAPEVSALDYSDEVTLSGFTVPGLTSRKVNTEVELQNGQSFMIGGLLNDTVSDAFQKIPFLGDIPIIGKLFQSETKTKNNNELIVIVTPEIVAPYPADTPIPALHQPDKYLPPNSNLAMHQPDAKTAETTLPPTPATIPVEALIKSMTTQRQLIIESGSGGFGTSGGAINPANNTSPVAAPNP
ncbi:MAG: type II and III secretion system protein family protein [Terracidiphilus sp.]